MNRNLIGQILPACVVVGSVLTSCGPATEGNTMDLASTAKDNPGSTDWELFDGQLDYSKWDTTSASKSIGCQGSFFALLGDSAVLEVQLYFEVSKYLTIELELDSTKAVFDASLWLFKKGEAHLGNICTDVIVVNLPERQVECPAIAGRIIAHGHPRQDFYGNDMPVTSLTITKLVFQKPGQARPIELHDVLLWKVLDLGVAG